MVSYVQILCIFQSMAVVSDSDVDIHIFLFANVALVSFLKVFLVSPSQDHVLVEVLFLHFFVVLNILKHLRHKIVNCDFAAESCDMLAVLIIVAAYELISVTNSWCVSDKHQCATCGYLVCN